MNNRIIIRVIVGLIVIGGIFVYFGFYKNNTGVNTSKVTKQFNSEISALFEKDLQVIQGEDRQKPFVTSDRRIINEFMYIFDENDKAAQ